RVLAANLGVSDARIHTLLALTLLSPAILSRALNGDLPSRVNLKRLLAAAKLLDWTRQRDSSLCPRLARVAAASGA
ncbi:MAG: hypothetical protein AAF663_00835, partial [Planctomycetota bacterium]